MTTPSFTQVTWRGRNDDGSETTATWKWTQGTDGTVNAGENFRLRFRIDETASRAWTNKTWNLYYSTDDSTYNPLTGSTPVQLALSDNFAQGADCTAQLTGGTGTFVTDNNGMCESAGATNSGTAGYLFEVEYCVKFIPSIATHNQVYYFKVYDGSSAIGTYTDRPAITCSNLKATPTDGLTVGESKTVVVSDLFINATDGLTVGESKTVECQELDRNINVTDGVTLGDSVSYFSEDVLVGESVTVVVEEAVADREIPDAADNVTLGEAVTVWTDTYRINVSDGIAVGESKTVENPALIRSVTDGLTVGESQTIQNTTLTTNVTDNLTVGESKTVENTTLYRSVSDDLTVGESKTVDLEASPPIEIGFVETIKDPIELGESVTVTVSSLSINVTDGLTVGDTLTNIRIAANLFIVRSDGLNVADVLTEIKLASVGEIEIEGISDNVTVGESKTLEITTLYRSLSDGLTVGESKTVEIAGLFRSVSDGLTVGETKSVEIANLYRNVTDGLTVGESKTVTVSDLNISVSDNLTVADSLTDIETSTDETISINVSDGITLTDSVNYFSEDVLVGESLVIEVYYPSAETLQINVSDDVFVGEAPFSGWGEMEVSAIDGITLGESQSVELGPTTTFTINVTDGITLGESKSVEIVNTIFVNIGWEDEKAQLGESVQLVVSSLNINVVDNLSVSDATLMVILPTEGIFYINITNGIQLAEEHSQIVENLQINIPVGDEKVEVLDSVSVLTALRIDVTDNVQLNYSLLALYREATVTIPNLFANATDNGIIGEVNNLYIVLPYDAAVAENIQINEQVYIAIVDGEGSRGCAEISDELNNIAIASDELVMSVVASDELNHQVVIGDVNCD